jgi:3-oxoacyl-[acyl-carrier protein] reductase
MSITRILFRVYKALLSPLRKKVEARIITLAPNQLLEGRTALITGATSGIGYAIAEAYLIAGATVVVAGRNKEKVDKCVCELKSKCQTDGKVYSVLMDVLNTSEMDTKIKEVLSLLPSHKIDILVNNAGIGGVSGVSEEKEYDLVMDTNLKSVYFLTQKVARHMITNHIHGNILNIASSSSLRPAGGSYGLSKWGIRGLTEGMSKMLIPYGIVVNAVGPGATATPFMRKKKGDEISNKTIPAGRFVMPEEVANVAVFLTSGMGRMIVGDVVYITGGTGTITCDDISYDFN